jgi:hypothetical protein
MPACAVKRGIIALRDCGAEGVNVCTECGRPACAEHTRIQSGSVLCVECYARREQAASAAAKGGSGTSRAAKTKYPSSSGTDNEAWDDLSFPFTYRHHYYSSYDYSPIYYGSYYDSYYDDYDVRSFDSTAQADLDADAPDAGGFYDS